MANSHTPTTSVVATHQDVLRVFGDIDQQKVLEILALRPTIAEIEEASLWVAGDGDVLAKAGHPLAGVAAEVFDILAVNEEEPDPDR